MPDAQDLCATLASRICHDLINPIGAINNGVELMSMNANGGRGAEMALIRESVESAAARIRFIRVAFGVAMPGQFMGRTEIVTLLDDWADGRRLAVEWRVEGDQRRIDVRRVFLALMCAETILPGGGLITVLRPAEFWSVKLRGARFKVDADVWSIVTSGASMAALPPAMVQFGLLASDLRVDDARLRLTEREDSIDLVVPVRQS